jgi:hypothetical protein
MENIRHEIEVHGNAVQADPAVKVARRFDRASITMNGVRHLHFPITTPTIVNGKRLEAGKIWLRFKTYEGPNASRISLVKVFDGEKSIFEREVDVKRTEDGQVSFDFPGRVPVGWGLNIILGVGYEGDNASIDIIGVGIVFF